jgi:hypothetical protein
VATASGTLLRYRLSGGPVRIDYDLTIRDDGTAEVDERHRSRDPIRLEIPSRELERIRTLLASLSEPTLSFGERFGRLFAGSGGMKIRLEWDVGKITRTDPDDPTLVELLELLDQIRLRAVRSVPR